MPSILLLRSGSYLLVPAVLRVCTLVLYIARFLLIIIMITDSDTCGCMESGGLRGPAYLIMVERIRGSKLIYCPADINFSEPNRSCTSWHLGR